MPGFSRSGRVAAFAGTRSLPGLALLVLGLALLAPGLAGCGRGDAPQSGQEGRQPAVAVEAVQVATLADRLELTGSIEPTRVARMASPVEGPVVACPVREGDRVQGGTVVARLGRARGDDAAAAAAGVELEREEQDLARIEALVESGALPGEDLDEARVRVSDARARIEQATERLADYRVTAAWSGVVSRVHVAVGDFVAARAPLVELFDPASLVLRFAVPEDRAVQVVEGGLVDCELDAHPGRRFTASITRVYPDIDRQSHTRTVEATLDAAVELMPGMFARLQLTVASAPDALVVPEEAIVHTGGQTALFVVGPEGTAERRTVRTGIEDGGRVQILEGVAEGERVATAGHNRLRDGAKVRIAGPGGGQDGGHTAGGERSPENRP